MLNLLEKYNIKNVFDFASNDSLAEKCNAPTDYSGVYLVYKVKGKSETLIYIGSSGQKTKDGKLKTRKSGLGGMKDRLVNGYHPKFGKIKRKKSWPEQMSRENIKQLKIYWFVTYDDVHKDFPTDIERLLVETYLKVNKQLPDWHK